jgi:hypothetical protein
MNGLYGQSLSKFWEKIVAQRIKQNIIIILIIDLEGCKLLLKTRENKSNKKKTAKISFSI